jgi:hypothetical protein
MHAGSRVEGTDCPVPRRCNGYWKWLVWMVEDVRSIKDIGDRVEYEELEVKLEESKGVCDGVHVRSGRVGGDVREIGM